MNYHPELHVATGSGTFLMHLGNERFVAWLHKAADLSKLKHHCQVFMQTTRQLEVYLSWRRNQSTSRLTVAIKSLMEV